MNKAKYENSIINVPDFPIKGIQFKDVTTLFEDPKAFHAAVEDMIEAIDTLPEFNKIIALDARGFILGGPLALHYNVPLVLARKPGKLPRPGISVSYELEYGRNAMSISEGSLQKGDKAIAVDDLLATGGSINCIKQIAKQVGCEVVGAAVIIELDDLGGRKKLEDTQVVSLLHYAGE